MAEPVHERRPRRCVDPQRLPGVDPVPKHGSHPLDGLLATRRRDVKIRENHELRRDQSLRFGPDQYKKGVPQEDRGGSSRGSGSLRFGETSGPSQGGVMRPAPSQQRTALDAAEGPFPQGLRRSPGWVLKLLKDCTGLQSVTLRNHNPRGSPPYSGLTDRTLEQVPFDYRTDAGVFEGRFQQVGLRAMLGPVDLDQTSLAHFILCFCIPVSRCSTSTGRTKASSTPP